MKLIDCFMFFDENIVLDIRLNTLNEVVDKFVIAEGTRDHMGNSKKLNFDINNFSRFKGKIEYLIIDDIPEDVGYYKKDWEPAHLRDQFQRNALTRGYDKFDGEDLIMISDIDEIPDPKRIKEFKLENKYACFILKNFQSKLNLMNITSSDWSGTKICQKKNLKSPQWLRNIKTKKRPFWKFYKSKEPQLINNAGWHFSFLKDPQNISKKIKSYSHQEFNKENFTNIKNIEKKIEKRIDIFGRDYEYKKIELNDNFPEYILKNREKFKKWII
jgi:beta-1,4-mannosyl-glycoprotein beta-1,4-N-acetylglucosaminyltransferase